MASVEEVTPEERRTIAARCIINALDEIDSARPDLGHVRAHVSDALIWLGIYRGPHEMFDSLERGLGQLGEARRRDDLIDG